MTCDEIMYIIRTTVPHLTRRDMELLEDAFRVCAPESSSRTSTDGDKYD